MSFKKILIAATLVAPIVFAPLAFVYAADAKADVLKVDPSASSVEWIGKKVTGQHNGSVPVKEGEVKVANNNIVGGRTAIDVANLKVLDLEGESKGKLEGHLKSPDFFEVEKHPVSTFEVTSAKPLVKDPNGFTHEVSGNLTIKGKTNPLTFPARVTLAPGSVTIDAKEIKVDRTLYDIEYGSGKFFQGLGDKVIYDDFWLNIKLVAKK